MGITRDRSRVSLVAAAFARVRVLWGPRWPLPAMFFLGYCVLMAVIDDLRIEHLLVTALAIVLAYASQSTKRFFLDMVPFLLIAVGFDLIRYPRQALLRPDKVLGCGLRDFELALFPAGDGVTWQDFFAAHHNAVADFAAAVPYTMQIYFAFLYGVFLFFVDRPRMRFFLWSLAVANYIGFVMWMLVPAAPPWYLRANGCVIDIQAAPSAAGLLRVDALLGISYFREFYSRGSTVFGALPSLHCAFPVIGLLTAWRSVTWKTRPLHILYSVWMLSAAVYLDHHWIVDGIAGWLVALSAVCSVRAVLRRLEMRKPEDRELNGQLERGLAPGSRRPEAR